MFPSTTPLKLSSDIPPSIWKSEVAASIRYLPFHLSNTSHVPASGSRLLDTLISKVPGLPTAEEPEENLSIVDLVVSECLDQKSETLAKLGTVDDDAISNILKGVAMIIDKLVAKGSKVSTRSYDMVKNHKLKVKDKLLRCTQQEKVMHSES